jgi:NADPH:quinone reductase-like Zn-dependent oxidoreductase
MKAVVISRYGGPEVLEYREVPAPVVQDDEVLVRVAAASVNPIDWQLRDGLVKLFIRVKFPVILGCDVAGTVVQVGRRVSRLRAGDEVFAMMPHDWGAQAELVAIPAALVLSKPAGMSMVEAASVPATAVTAVHALRDIAGVRPGQEVLINGASGGVGIFSVQVAKALGATVTAVCGEASFPFVKELGADHLVDYRTTDFTKGKQRYDVIFDCIGNHQYGSCRRVLRGKWVHVTTMPKTTTFLRPLRNPFTRGKVSVIIAKPTGERMGYIKSLIDAGEIRTVIDRVFPVADVAKAQDYSKSGRAKGKIVLTFES